MTTIIRTAVDAIRMALASIVLAIDTAKVIEDDDLAALTIWMEARGEIYTGQVAVGEVIRNRMKAGKKTAAEIVLAPYQFSCWNTQDSNRLLATRLTRSNPQYIACLQAWQQSAGSNLTKGANHYVNLKIASPIWAKPAFLTSKIGSHSFYKL